MKGDKIGLRSTVWLTITRTLLLLINDDAPRPDGEVGEDAIMFTNHVCAAPFGGVGEGAGGWRLVLQK